MKKIMSSTTPLRTLCDSGRLTLLFVVGIMAAGASMAESVSPCSVDMVPIQIVGERGRPVTTLSAAIAGPKFGGVPGSAAEYLHRSNLEAAGPYANLGGVPFGPFVATVTEYLAARLAKENLCLDNPDSKERSLLQFVNWPHVAWWNKAPPPMQPLDAPPSSGCRLSSPWVDLAFERKPVPWIRGIVRWNARQFLADQAVLDGVQDVPPGVVIPMELREYHRLSDKYRDFLFLRWQIVKDIPALRAIGIAIDESKAQEVLDKSELMEKQIEEGIPPDILWFFRRAQFTSLAGFGDGRVQMEKGTEGYTKLIIALIDRCLASDGADIRYNSIMDVADPSLLEQYKIDMPPIEIFTRRKTK